MNFDNNSLYNIKSSVDGKRYSLFELATWKNGLAFKKINFCETGVPVIKIAELNNGIGGTTAYTQQTFSEEVHLCKGDLLFSWSGNPQTSIDIFRFNLDEGWLNQHIFKVTPDEKIVDRDYFYFLMKNLKPHFTQIATNKQTTGLGHVTIADIKRMSVVIPSLDVQREMVSYIKPIDDKIELNNEINNNLEQQTQAIFKSWFVDFELNYGIMPSDWKVSQLGSIAKISTEVFSPAKNPNAEVEHYSIPAYDEKRYPVFETSNGIKSNKYRLSSNSVMISKLNPDTKRIWRPYCISDKPICSTEFIVYEPINPLNRDFIYSIIDSIGFSAFLCSHTTGSTNSRQRATPSVTLTYDIIVPDEKTIQAFCSIVSPMYDTIENNIKENQKLAETRDKLLPKLMSGELDVSDIDL